MAISVSVCASATVDHVQCWTADCSVTSVLAEVVFKGKMGV